MTDNPPNLSGETPSVSVHYRKREFVMYPVTDEELDLLRAVVPTTSLAFFGVVVGVDATCWVTLATQAGLSIDSHAVFLVGGVVGGVLALFFAVIAGTGYLRLSSLKKKIRELPLHLHQEVGSIDEPWSNGEAGRMWRGEERLL